MAMFDLSLPELREYRPEVAEPADFDQFWGDTIEQAREFDLNPRLEPIDARASLYDTWQVTFAGFDGHDIFGWLHVPAGASEPVPLVVLLHGYSGGRGMPFPDVYVGAGYAQFTFDTRGQGWNAATIFEQTPDLSVHGNQFVPGLMTSGILDPEQYYYRRVFIDVLRGLEVAQQLPQIDPEKIVVTGGSQGGGMAIAGTALAAMAGVKIAGAMPDVPFLCYYRRATEIVDSAPYSEIATHLKGRPHDYEQVFHTLSYFDGVNFAKRARVPTLWSVALSDAVCPPSTVFAAYNNWAGDDRDIKVYPYNGHEGGRELQRWEQLGWLRDRLHRVAKPATLPRRGRRN